MFDDSPARGWLRLWHGPPPQPGKWALSEDVFSYAADSPPGPHEILVVARDEVSGRLVAQAAPFNVEAALLPESYGDKTLCESTQAVIFSCKSGRRFISVCASQDLLRGDRTPGLSIRSARSNSRIGISWAVGETAGCFSFC